MIALSLGASRTAGRRRPDGDALLGVACARRSGPRSGCAATDAPARAGRHRPIFTLKSRYSPRKTLASHGARRTLSSRRRTSARRRSSRPPGRTETATARSLAQPLVALRLQLADARSHAAAAGARGRRATTMPSRKFVVPMNSATNWLRGLLVDLARRADLHDAALVHHRDLVRQRQRLALVVGDVDRVMPSSRWSRLSSKRMRLAQLGVEIGQRLVEQQQLRLDHERAGQREALLLAAGELGRLAVGEMIELRPWSSTRITCSRISRLRELWRRPAAGTRRSRTRSCAARSRRTGTPCRDRACSAGRRSPRLDGIDHAAVDLDLARCRAFEAGDRAQRRRLAAARGPEQREQLALRHRRSATFCAAFDHGAAARWRIPC